MQSTLNFSQCEHGVWPSHLIFLCLQVTQAMGILIRLTTPPGTDCPLESLDSGVESLEESSVSFFEVESCLSSDLLVRTDHIVISAGLDGHCVGKGERVNKQEKGLLGAHG